MLSNTYITYISVREIQNTSQRAQYYAVHDEINIIFLKFNLFLHKNFPIDI